MEEKKHIDRLYQEKFKDFDATPPDMVWRNISSRLNEKKRKESVFPIWYRIAGVAVLLALLFNVSDVFKTAGTGSTNLIAEKQNEHFGDFDLTSDAYHQNMSRSSIVLQALMLDTKSKAFEEMLRTDGATSTFRNSIVLTALTENQLRGIKASPYKVREYLSLSTENMESPRQPVVIVARELPLPSAINSEEHTQEALWSSGSKRMQVTTTAAPIYFNNIGSGQAIDPQFEDNESGSAASLAYGLNVAYQLSDKIRIRSGINKVDLNYNTRNIAFTAAVNPVALSGIQYGEEIPKYRIENSSARRFSNVQASAEFNRASMATPASGYLHQKLGFIEVPLEVEYVLIDKRIGLNIIGGGSTLFLNENMISLNAANFSTELGSANNLNSVSFSTNLGVGIDYNISPQFQMNLEPIFKYQINTFNTSSSENPYYFGVYSGFSFKF